MNCIPNGFVQSSSSRERKRKIFPQSMLCKRTYRTLIRLKIIAHIKKNVAHAWIASDLCELSSSTWHKASDTVSTLAKQSTGHAMIHRGKRVCWYHFYKSITVATAIFIQNQIKQHTAAYEDDDIIAKLKKCQYIPALHPHVMHLQKTGEWYGARVSHKGCVNRKRYSHNNHHARNSPRKSVKINDWYTHTLSSAYSTRSRVIADLWREKKIHSGFR